MEPLEVTAILLERVLVQMVDCCDIWQPAVVRPYVSF